MQNFLCTLFTNRHLTFRFRFLLSNRVGGAWKQAWALAPQPFRTPRGLCGGHQALGRRSSRWQRLCCFFFPSGLPLPVGGFGGNPGLWPSDLSFHLVLGPADFLSPHIGAKSIFFPAVSWRTWAGCEQIFGNHLPALIAHPQIFIFRYESETSCFWMPSSVPGIGSESKNEINM